ncbi:MAG: hypothetical protein JSR85_00185 [Proteobacteria bacterium]|nr:hypothetical protein [Pseudomonadota bacterium]
MTYEAARSITGPYLATLGASAAVVGFVAGFDFLDILCDLFQVTSQTKPIATGS